MKNALGEIISQGFLLLTAPSLSRPKHRAGHLGRVGRERSIFHRLWRRVGRIFPEVVDVGEGVGADAGVVGVVEVVLQDGDNAAGDIGGSGKRGVVEAVLTVAVGVIEAAPFRRAAEALGLGQGVEVDDGDLLHHHTGVGLIAADTDVGGVVGAVIAELGGDVASFPGERDAVEIVLDGEADDVGEDLVGRAAAGDGVLVGNHRGLFLLIVVVARRAAIHVHGGVDDSGSVDGNVWRLCYALFRASRIRFW